MIPRSLPKNRSARRPSVRRSNRRAAAFSLALSAMLASVLPFGQRAQAADSLSTVITTATDLSDPNSYTPTGTPTATSDVLFTGTYTTPTFNVNGAALTYGTLDDVSTQTLTIGDTSATPGSITLSSVANLTTSTGAGNAADVIFVKSGSSLTINNVAVNIATASGNNIDTGGTLTFGATSTLSLGTTTTTFSGAGATTINGTIVNTAGGLTVGAGTTTLAGVSGYTGTTTLTAGTLNLNSATALGGLMDPNFGTTSGTAVLNLNGGTLNNTSGAALTLTFNAPITIGGNFTFGTAASTNVNNLNLGNGAVTIAAGRTVTVLGTGTTLTMGGVTSYTGATTTAATSGNNTFALTVNGPGNTLSLGGLAIDTNTSSTAATTFGEAGTGTLVINGPVTNGNTLANGITTNTFNQTNALTLLGTNSYTGLTNIQSGTLNLGGDNTAATGGLTVNNATLNLLSNTALGSGALSIGVASINNTGTAALTESNNPAITLTNNLGFNILNRATATSANNLNLGTGAVSMTNSREIFLGGAGTTLVFGGAFTNTTTGGVTLTLFGGGNTLSLGALNLASNTSGTQTFNVVGSGNLTVPGTVANGVTGGSNQLFINSTGTVTLSGANTYTGVTSISGGTLALDYTTNNNSKIATATTLVLGGNLGGGTVNLVGNSAAFTQTVGNTNLNYGTDVVTRSAGTTVLALGAINRGVGSNINFTAANAATTTTGNTAGILGGYATFGAATGSADWATNVGTGGTAPTQFTAYTSATGTLPANITSTANGDTNNTLFTGGGALAGNVVTNSLKINSTTGTPQSLTIPTGSALAVTSGGLLYTGSDAYTISGGTLRNGGVASTDLIVQQYGAGTLTINSAITDSNFGSSTFGSTNPTSLTKAGPGTLVLGANSYTGATYVNAGTLQLNVANSLLPTSALVVNGTLNLNGNSQAVDAFNGTGTVVNNGAGAATFSIGNGNNNGGIFLGSINNGTGTLSLVKNGSGNISLQGVNTYSGPTLVNGGTLQINGQSGAILNSTSITVTGATLNVGDLNGPANRLNPATVLTLGGANGGGNFNTGRLASGIQNLNIATLNIGLGTAALNNQTIGGTTADSGFLQPTAASGANFSRSAGGFLIINGGGGDLNLGFVNPVTTSTSGVLGSTALLIGSVTNGSNSSFTSPSAGTGNAVAVANVLSSGTFTAASNTVLTNTAGTVTAVTDTTSVAQTINSLQFASATTATSTTTLSLGANLTVSSGGILAGNMPNNVNATISGTGTLSSGSSQDLWMYVNNPLTISAPIADNNANAAANDLTGGISKSGTGLLTLSGANTFAGPIYVTQGSLGVNNANASGTASALGLTTSTAPVFITGATVQALSNFSTSRNFVLGGGTDTNIIATAAAITVGTTTTNTPFAVVLNGVISSQGTQSTNIAAGTGQLSITSTVPTNPVTTVAGGSVTLGGANTFTGGTTVGVGATLYLNNALALQNSQFNGGAGTLAFGAPGGATTLTAFTFGGLGSSTGIALTNNATTPAPVTLTIGNNNQNASTSSAIGGAGSLIKTGLGTQTFTGASGFTGTLTISGGAVNATTTNNFSAISGLAINGGGTLLLSGSTTTRIADAAPVTMNGGTISLAPGAREGTALNRTGAGVTTQTSPNTTGLGMLTLTASSAINFAGTSGTLVIGTGAASAFDPTNGGAGNFTLTVFGTNFGTSTLGGESINDRLLLNQLAAPTTAQLSDIVFNQGGTLYTASAAQVGTTNYYDIVPGALAAVPEPSTWAAFLLGLGTLGFSQRRRIGSFRRHGQGV